MSIEQQVRESKNPQEALLHIAVALDVILEQVLREPEPDPWGAWSTDEEHAEVQRLFQEKVDEEKGETVVEIPPPSPERYAERLAFARNRLQLDDYYSNVGAPEPEGTNEPALTWSEVYAKGGPYWLYVSDRECVMSYPYPIRAAMVEDVEQDDPQTAKEMGRDVLKHPSETGPGGVGMGTDLGPQ